MRRRPVPVTIFAIFVLFLTAWNGIRLYAAITSWALLKELGARPGPIYIVLTGLAWVVIGLAVFRGAWAGRVWAPMAGWLYLLAYIAYFWADRLFLRPLERSQDVLLVACLQLTALGVTAAAFSAPGSRSYFRQGQKNDGSA